MSKKYTENIKRFQWKIRIYKIKQKDILELKNITSGFKNPLDRFQNKLDIEERINEFKGGLVTTVQIEPQKLKWKARVCPNVRHTQNIVIYI